MLRNSNFFHWALDKFLKPFSVILFSSISMQYYPAIIFWYLASHFYLSVCRRCTPFYCGLGWYPLFQSYWPETSMNNQLGQFYCSLLHVRRTEVELPKKRPFILEDGWYLLVPNTISFFVWYTIRRLSWNPFPSWLFSSSLWATSLRI